MLHCCCLLLGRVKNLQVESVGPGCKNEYRWAVLAGFSAQLSWTLHAIVPCDNTMHSMIVVLMLARVYC